MRPSFRRPGTLVPGLLLLIPVLSCGSDDGSGPAAEPEIASIRLQAGSQVLTVLADGRVVGAPLELPVASSLQLAATFTDVQGDLVTLRENDYLLHVKPADTARVRFDRVSSYRGTLRAAGGGATALEIGLYDALGREFELGPHAVPTTVGGGGPGF